MDKPAGTVQVSAESRKRLDALYAEHDIPIAPPAFVEGPAMAFVPQEGRIDEAGMARNHVHYHRVATVDETPTEPRYPVRSIEWWDVHGVATTIITVTGTVPECGAGDTVTYHHEKNPQSGVDKVFGNG